MHKVAVLQSNYIPWKGYFDIIHDVDLFVFYDDVQFTKNDWRNRNRVKTQNGATWLTIPTGTDLDRLICEVSVPNSRWEAKHYKTLVQYYSKAPFFGQYRSLLEDIYLSRSWDNLSTLNQYIIKVIARECLGITTKFADSQDYSATGTRLDRLIDVLEKCEATHYLSGPAAKNYIDHKAFAKAGIEIIYKDYSGYPEYPQYYPPFDHFVTIFDLLFHTGPNAPWYIWGWRNGLPQPEYS